MEEFGYNITQKEFKEICNKVGDIYNTVVVVDYAWLSALNGHAYASALCRQSAFVEISKK